MPTGIKEFQRPSRGTLAKSWFESAERLGLHWLFITGSKLSRCWVLKASRLTGHLVLGRFHLPGLR